jgi:hypothetical protein
MRRSLVLTVLLSLGLGGCGQTANQGGVPTTSPSSETSAATNAPPSGTAQPNATPRPTAQFPAPAGLQGTWQAIVDEGDDRLTLKITETGYTITRVVAASPAGITLSGSGRVEVDGDEIVFSSSLCDGDGRYRWSIEGDLLRFTPIAPDPCPRPLDGIDYTRDG